jgi:hypothetical protein
MSSESSSQIQTPNNRKEKKSCQQTLFDFTVCSVPRQKEFIERFSMPTRWPNGFRQMDSPARFIRWTPKLAALTKCRLQTSSTDKSHSFGGTYVELTPNERIRYTDKFDDPNLPGEMQATITLKKVSCGTELNIVQEGVPDVIPAEACYLGWQESLTLIGETCRS